MNWLESCLYCYGRSLKLPSCRHLSISLWSNFDCVLSILNSFHSLNLLAYSTFSNQLLHVSCYSCMAYNIVFSCFFFLLILMSSSYLRMISSNTSCVMIKRYSLTHWVDCIVYICILLSWDFVNKSWAWDRRRIYIHRGKKKQRDREEERGGEREGENCENLQEFIKMCIPAMAATTSALRAALRCSTV